ncbi:hypothetical protein CSUI_003692 [Cystoisospora suis]|uniref:Uncharacterized protein n=1 Tax=Cystoisospora suis TaxID=483139 RepID=A0A2C6KZV6_9APIC|nr:hypothetical protein CSUI_003692 [Cystoisospora suis]
MPGIYAKPPKRTEMLREVAFMLSLLEKRKKENNWSEVMNICLPMLLDELAAERVKARAEAAKEKEKLDAEAGDQNKVQSLADLEARKEKEVAEVFFVGGLHTVLCDLLELACQHPEIGDVMPILNEYQRLLLTEIDPFDDDIGCVPLLVYFLSERHHFYVDIHWQHQELTLMQKFLSALLSLLKTQQGASAATKSPASRTSGDATVLREQDGSSSATAVAEQPEQTRVAAVKLLCRTLFSYPPHRVVSRMAAVFDPLRCRTLVDAIVGASTLWDTPKGLNHIAQTTASIAIFGIGAPLVSALVPASLLWVASTNLIRESRCPCTPCELQRRLIKISRNRDEIGVLQAAQDKKQICYSLVRGGMPILLAKLFRAVGEMRRHEGLWRASSPDREYDQDSCYLDQALQFASWTMLLCSWSYEEMHGGESILSVNNDTLLVSVLECFPISQKTFLDSLTSMDLPGTSSVLAVTLHLILRLPPATRHRISCKSNVVFRPLLDHIGRLLAARDPYPAAAKPAPEPADATTSASLPQEDLCLAKNQGSYVWGELTVAAVTDGVGNDQTDDPGDPDSRQSQVKVDMLLLAPAFMGLLQSVFSQELPTETGNEGQREPPREVHNRKALVTMGIAASQALVNIYEYLRPLLSKWENRESQQAFENREQTVSDVKASGTPFLPSREYLPPFTAPSLLPGFDYRTFYYSVTSAMLTLLGGMKLHSLPERRWRFAENPAAEAGGSAAIGGLASAARKILGFQKKELDEGCTYIKNASNIIILRAEQASALLLREEVQTQVKVFTEEELCCGGAEPRESVDNTSTPHGTVNPGAPGEATKRTAQSGETDTPEDWRLLTTTTARQAAC